MDEPVTITPVDSVVKRTFKVTGVGELTHMTSAGRRIRIRPDEIVIRINRIGPNYGQVRSVAVFGRRILLSGKKAGELGDRDCVSYRRGWSDNDPALMPDWLAQLLRDEDLIFEPETRILA
jgi:hypothetical protein